MEETSFQLPNNQYIVKKKRSGKRRLMFTCLPPPEISFLSIVFVCLSGEVMFRWIYNDFPNFIIPDQRRFVSQTTGNLYIAKVEASDVGNYSCFVSSPTIGKSVFSMPISLIPQIESECFHITHNTKILTHNCLTETTVVLKVNE